MNIFQSNLISDFQIDSNGNITNLKYMEGEILKIFSKLMNFSIDFVTLTNSSSDKYGHKSENGTFVGSLGFVEYGKVDLLANTRIIANYGQTQSKFLHPIKTIKLHFIVPKATHEDNLLASFQNLFQAQVLWGILLTLLIIPLVDHSLRSFQYSKKFTYQSLIKNYLNFVGAFFMISVKMPKYQVSRIVWASMLVFSTVIGGIIVGAVIEILNDSLNRSGIRSIEQALDSGIDIIVPPAILALFEVHIGSQSRIYRAINKIAMNKTLAEMKFIGKVKNFNEKRNYIEFVPELHSRPDIANTFDNITGRDLLYVIPKCAYEFHVAQMIPRNSPFVDRFNEIIMWIIEAGIQEYQLKLAEIDNDMIYIRRTKNGNFAPQNIQMISFNILRNVFLMYLTFNLIAFVVFLLEVLWKFTVRFLTKK